MNRHDYCGHVGLFLELDWKAACTHHDDNLPSAVHMFTRAVRHQ